jgi:hypothetical protein
MPKRKPRRLALDLHGLIGREDLFRITGALKRDPAIDIWFTGGSAELRSIAQKWFARMRQCGGDVRELMHDGCPVACVEDAPFGYVNTFKSHVNVGFFRGAMLEDSSGILEGNGKRMRHVKLSSDRPANETALADLIDAAYADIKARLEAERSPGP